MPRAGPKATYMHTYTHIYKQTERVRERETLYTNTYMHINTWDMCVHLYIYINTYVQVCVYKHIYIHTHWECTSINRLQSCEDRCMWPFPQRDAR